MKSRLVTKRKQLFCMHGIGREDGHTAGRGVGRSSFGRPSISFRLDAGSVLTRKTLEAAALSRLESTNSGIIFLLRLTEWSEFGLVEMGELVPFHDASFRFLTHYIPCPPPLL